MIHIYKPGGDSARPVLALLHGTGGNELDLLPLGERLSPGSALLGIRGNVLENGMPRFFRRLAEGVFDEEDLTARTHELRAFLDEAAREYGFDRSRVVAVGYSNGANIAASLLQHYRGVFAGAVLLHPMVPLRGREWAPQPGTPVFIGAGTNDPIVPGGETAELQGLLEAAGAQVAVHWSSQGHRLNAAEAEAAREWLGRLSYKR
ncbi:alpha/beta hydrolase [Paenibacillus glufosinatiresistens]|uniref:alpha/beta hydrolase n=1 Tax=Paenibacillus glufosinatiresistens TaxID=3070657 RepID=UPI00286DA903|nr:alpha/beta hydrolase [Paenibacillus sp. YX.27]